MQQSGAVQLRRMRSPERHTVALSLRQLQLEGLCFLVKTLGALVRQ